MLVAEDNYINQQVIAEQLSRLGYRAEIVSNGREALALWRRGGFGALLTDLQMPEMDGYELTASIRPKRRAGANADHRVDRNCAALKERPTVARPPAWTTT